MPRRAIPTLALLAVALALPTRAGATLQPLDPAPFRLQFDGPAAAKSGLADELARSLPSVGIDGVLAHLNRRGAPLPSGGGAARAVGAIAAGFTWNADDNGDTGWYPQGITGSADASPDGVVAGRELLAVSWYSRQGQGTRVTFIDAASLAYRHVLLVDPARDAKGAPSFTSVPVHAGGIAWYGPYLYVVDTHAGIRVFDTRRILEVNAVRNAVGRGADGTYSAYAARYVLPQIGRYVQQAGTGLRFSFVSVDRTAVPNSLITGEYLGAQPGGRIVRWPLDATSGAPVGGTQVQATQALSSDLAGLQGAASVDGQLFLSASRPDRSGVLGSARPGAPIGTAPWASGPEDLMYAPATHRLYSLTEHPGARTVFAIAAAAGPDQVAPAFLAGPAAAPPRLRRRSHTSLTFTLSEPARVSVAIQRRRGGRTFHGRCVRSRRRLRHRRFCWRYVTAASVRSDAAQGANAVRVGARVGRRRLRNGSYRVEFEARDSAGNRSAPVSTTIRIVR